MAWGGATQIRGLAARLNVLPAQRLCHWRSGSLGREKGIRGGGLPFLHSAFFLLPFPLVVRVYSSRNNMTF